LRGSLFWTALAVAVLAPRVGDAGVIWRWAPRLAYHALGGVIGPALDLIEMQRRWRAGLKPVAALALTLILPVLGGSLFLGLFAIANPIIGQALGSLTWPSLDVGRVVFWMLILMGVWSFLRPRMLGQAAARPTSDQAAPPWPLPGAGSVGLSLIVFNALFAVQNGLDLAFLWSGAPLPQGVTVTDYVHRGAFTLIVTALLAGAFVLVAMRPGSASASKVWVRRLVVVWVAQNLVLVASSMMRTLDYIRAFDLTGLRIAALIWMGLVAVGLALICWRMLRGKSANWLVGANLWAAGLVLIACSLVDLNAVAAAWNVRNAQEVNGRGGPIDLCYLSRMGPSALVPLSELAQRPLRPDLHDRVAALRANSLKALQLRQSAWRGWSWRGQRRLDQALTILPAGGPAAAFIPGPRDCDGMLISEQPAADPAPAGDASQVSPGSPS
jgi:hypothetical protein